jgi:hypothetical protein
MGVIVGASLLISILAVVAGWMGSHDYLGFTVMSRAYVERQKRQIEHDLIISIVLGE